MNKQETIASLAAELTRIGKMPWWIEQHNDAFALCQMGVNDESFIEIEEAVLSALLGVAAEVLALGDVVIRTVADGRLGVYNWEGDPLSVQLFDTYPEAVVAALKTIEEVKNE